jgi:thiamine-monophosphate kinase
MDLVVTKDLMAENVHFLSDDPPDLVARKLLRVNLSDLAAMGAAPLGYLVGAGLTARTDEDWIARFVAGLAADQAIYDTDLMGGDTIGLGDGPLVLSLTALGQVESGRTLTRSAARAGDLLVVSGVVGDAALGLACLKGEIEPDPSDRDHLIGRYRLPQPRLDLGRRLVGRASAALDVSDGLVADAGHLAQESGLAIEIEAAAVPLSDAVARLVADAPHHLNTAFTGGDDYELLFTIAEDDLAGLDGGEVPLSVIGRCRPGSGVTVVDGEGRDITPGDGGWRHPLGDP